MSLPKSSLFSDDLVQRFSRLEGLWREILQFRHHSKALQQKISDVEIVERRISEIREKLARTRFRVGFLGTSSAGKSTTLNNYLDQRSLLPEGDGRSCTSIRVRLSASKPSDGYEIQFTFLTRTAYRERRDDLACGRLNLFDRDGDQQYSDEAVLDLLNAATVQKEDKHYEVLLRKLIEAARSNRSLLSETSKPVIQNAEPAPVDDDDVRRWLKRTATHGGDAESKYALLDEIKLQVPGLALPQKLELVDLPGLGTARAADSDYTMRAIREMDAAIVAINFGGNLDVPENYALVKELRTIFDGDARRVWIIGTKLDSVDGERLWGNNDKNFPRMLASVLKQHELRCEQVSFVANTWFNKSEPTHTFIRVNHGINLSAEGEVTLPPTFDDHPEFAFAYRKFAVDGGILALKDVINGTMVEAITEGLTRQITQIMRTLAHDLSIAIQTAQQSAALGESGRTLVRRWRNAIDEVMYALHHESKQSGVDTPLRRISNTVRDEMHSTLEQVLKFCRGDETGDELAYRFQDMVTDMHQLAINGFGAHSELSKQYFGTIVGKLEKASSGIPVPAGIENPLEQFSRLLSGEFDEGRQGRLLKDIDSLRRSTLISDERGIPFGVNDLRRILEAKIDQVIRQTEYRHKNFVRIQLDRIASELRDLTPPESKNESIDSSAYLRFLKELAELVAEIQEEGAFANGEIVPSARSAVQYSQNKVEATSYSAAAFDAVSLDEADKSESPASVDVLREVEDRAQPQKIGTPDELEAQRNPLRSSPANRSVYSSDHADDAHAIRNPQSSQNPRDQDKY